MNKEELLDFINENADSSDFTGGVNESDIKSIENKLNINLSNTYKWFLKKFGMGGIFGVEILGFGKSSPASVITQTERYRRIGLPVEYVVIENCDEFIYCLATNKMNNNECPVISWDRISGFGGERGTDFVEFLANRLLDAKENWSE